MRCPYVPRKFTWVVYTLRLPTEMVGIETMPHVFICSRTPFSMAIHNTSFTAAAVSQTRIYFFQHYARLEI